MLLANDRQAQDDAPIAAGHLRRREHRVEGVAWYDIMENYERDLINRFCEARGLPTLK
jgi:hypothetical protein